VSVQFTYDTPSTTIFYIFVHQLIVYIYTLSTRPAIFPRNPDPTRPTQPVCTLQWRRHKGACAYIRTPWQENA